MFRRRPALQARGGAAGAHASRGHGGSPTTHPYDATFGYRTTVEQLSGGYGVTANLVARRDVIDAVGPFNEDFLSGGDVEWGRRAAAKGYRTEYVKAVRVRHKARTSIRMIFARQLRLAGGNQMNREREAAMRRARMLLDIVDTEIPKHLRWSLSALRTADGTKVERARVALLVVLVQVLRAAERIRVYLGGRPRRT